MRLRPWFLIAGIVVVWGLGYSEEDWQRQLDKYAALNTQNEAHRAELARHKARVAELEKQLEETGLKVSKLDEMKAALEDYKKRADTLERIKKRFEALRSKLQKLTKLGLEVSIRRNRMVVSLPGDVLFASGKDSLRDEGKDVLRQVADVVKGDAQLASRYFQVAGHTDNKPLAATKERFRDNWGLSLMRARTVLVYLTSAADTKGGGGGLDVTHWSASGYGQTDPIGENDSDSGRQRNRRVELILLPDVEEMLDLRTFL